MADQEPFNPALNPHVKISPRDLHRVHREPQQGQQPRPDSRPWVLGGGGDSFSVTSALLWCSVQSLLVGVARETPSGGGNKIGAQSGAASHRFPECCRLRTSQQLSGECAPGSPASGPATAGAPGTHPLPIGFSGPVADLSLARKVCRKSDPRREVVRSGPAVLPFPENAGSLPIPGLPGQLTFACSRPRVTLLPPPPAGPAEQSAILWATDTHCKAEG